MNEMADRLTVQEGGLDFLSGGGEMGARIRAFDWAATSLGHPADWPRNLRMALRIMFASRQPIWIGWGQDLNYFYNDAYIPILGGKHPWALGRPTAEVWRDIWGDIAPLLQTAMGGDQGTYVEAQLLIMQRHGYPEETYYTFSYSPVPNDDGSVGGIFCANSDDTARVVGERQMALLRELAAGTTHARTLAEVCDSSAAALATNPQDLPFAMLYLTEPDGVSARLAAVAGIDRGHPLAAPVVALAGASPWAIGEVLGRHAPRLVDDPGAAAGVRLPSGPWAEPPREAAVLPIQPTGETGRAGALVVGLSPFRQFDGGYSSFLGLVAGQIGAAIGSAQAYEEERRRAEVLAELDRAKTAFFSNVSHEFRTPLTLMLGPLEDLLAAPEGSLGTVQRGQLAIAHRNSLRLLKLVNSLLDFSRIEAGRMQASFEPTDMARFTAELASNFESVTARAGLALRVQCPPLPQKVFLDRNMWERIVLNLLSNAFKFTFDGELSVQVGVAADAGGAELVVRDTGVGIPEAELPRLFERFHRIEGQRGRSFEGSGIGLALVQELVKLHGGAIQARSRPGQGSEFIVTIPFGTTHLPPDRIIQAPAGETAIRRADVYVEEALRWLAVPGADADAAPRGDDDTGAIETPAADAARVLIADDNADMRDYVRRLLAPRWTVVTAPDGEAALAEMWGNKPDLVLADVMMPQMDGFALLQAVRADPALRDVPVILLSARAGEEARVEGLNAGADDYLTKPFAARELIARVNANLEMARIRREATSELRASEARFRTMADNAPVMIFVTDPAGDLTYLNRGWCEFTGQALEEAIGRGAWNAVHAEDVPLASALFFAASEARERFRVEYRLRRADGVMRWALSTSAPWFSDRGDYLGQIGSVIDITERREAEQILARQNELLEQRVAEAVAERAATEAQLVRAQKMESMGRLTGGVAHDFNNVLQIINSNLQMLNRDVAGNLRAEQRLGTAVAAVSRGAKLASQLLAFGRRTPLAPRVVNLRRLIGNMDDMLRRSLGESIEIETIVAAGLWNSFVDATQVENALLNLAINARDAMSGEGRLTIEAGNAFIDDAYASGHEDVAPGQYVMLAVTDTGCGMTPDIIEHVFEPFFTTKPEGQGTGLGLSMVYGFVKQSAGHVMIYSEPGQGTTVRIYLPRARGEEDVEVPVATGPVIGGNETILVVEDDEDVRATVVDMISDLGYRTLKASDAQSALAIVQSGIRIDLLFTDVVMPGTLRSPELARRARQLLPNLAVLFTSGYTDNAIVHGGRLDAGVELLSKPYSREALAFKLRQVLGQPKGAAPQVPPEAAAPERTEPNGGGRPETGKPAVVLLVEDEAFIRFNTMDVLQGLGFEVLEAANGADALNVLGAHAVDVLLTDLGLPGMSGGELAAHAVRRRPGLRVVFASGYNAVAQMQEEPLLARAVMLRKPYDDDDLEAAVRAALG